MKTTKHRLTKRDLYEYALMGALRERGMNYTAMPEEEQEILDKDISEIHRRIKLIQQYKARQE